MKFDPLIHHRRSIRLKLFDYSQPGAYFITLVTHNRMNIFGEIIDGTMRMNLLGEITEKIWERLPSFFPIQHDEWVIMPNHLHGIIWIQEPCMGEASAIPSYSSLKSQPADASPRHHLIGTKTGSLAAIIQNFKSISSRKLNQQILSPGSHVWQRNYYEHIIRNQSELERIHRYISDNPRQWSEDQVNQERL